MATIYENYYIGAFIHTLGFLAGARGCDQATALGLYQQTPLDRPLGDLLWSRGGKHVLIEFKARFSGLAHEGDKRVKQLLLSQIEQMDDRALRVCSYNAHFLAVGGWANSPELLYFAKYARLSEMSDETKFLTKATPFSEFSHLVLEGSIGADDDAFKRYMQAFQVCIDQVNSEEKEAAESKSGDSGSGISAQSFRPIKDAVPGGLVVTVAEAGAISMLPFSGVEMLRELQLSLGALQPEPPVRTPKFRRGFSGLG